MAARTPGRAAPSANARHARRRATIARMMTMSGERETGLSRFDRDPDAVAWARAKVVRLRDRYRGFEQSASAAGKFEQSSMWRRLANMIDMQMVGGKGCSIAAFDERLPAMTALLGGGEAGDGTE